MVPITTRKIGSGIRVAVAEMPEAPQISIEVRVRAGSAYESAKENGLSHLLEHAIFRGTQSMPDAHAHARALDRLATHSAATDPDQIALSFRCDPDDFEDLVALIGATIRSPSFSGLETEKEIVVHEIHEDLDDDGQQVDAGTIAASILYGAHPVGLPVTGDEARVRAFSLAQLKAFHTRICVGANISIGVGGPVDTESAIDTIECAFFGLPVGERANPPPPPQAMLRRRLVIVDGGTRADLCVALRGVASEHPLARACEVLARVLDGERPSGLLYEGLRLEKGRCYRLTCDAVAFEGAGHVEIQTRIRADQIARVTREVLDILERVARDGPDAETMAVMRRGLEREAAEAKHDPARVASALVAEMLADEEPSADPTGVDDLLAVTASEVRDVARMLVRPENLVVVCVGHLEKAERRLLDAAIGSWRPRNLDDGAHADAQRAPPSAAE